MALAGLDVRLLGELSFASDAGVARLPPSKKTRALLGFLVATAIPHRRQRLCDLLWDGPDDPRAELRWSLSKIRSAVGSARSVKIIAEREWIGCEVDRGAVDLHRLRSIVAPGIAELGSDELLVALELCTGELLDGLELPGCHRYHHWCLGEREAVSRIHLDILHALISRLDDRSDEALTHARALVAADPLSEVGHGAIVRLLGRLGRRQEALAHYHYAEKLLRTELAVADLTDLRMARRDLGSVAGFRTRPPVDQPRVNAPRLVGRQAERTAIDQMIEATLGGRQRHVVLLTGEPGIGKSRMLEHLADRARSSGCRVLHARIFEAEAERPYGLWSDVLAMRDAGEIPDDLRCDLALIRPDPGPAEPVPARRSRLFTAAAALLCRWLADWPIVFLCDDIQWLDPASVALLHHVIRSCSAPLPLLFACAARSGELEDNPGATGLVRALRREHRLTPIDLRPLTRDETAMLIRGQNGRADVASIVADSDGNPLLALALARDRTPVAGAAKSLDELVIGEFVRLPQQARSLLYCAAGLGRRFSAILLARVADVDAVALQAILDLIERRRIVQPDDGDSYIFVHDLVHQCIYRSMSQPRRRLLHRRISTVLADAVKEDAALAVELARHATLCGDVRLAAQACSTAGNRCLQVLANTEAARFATLGLLHLDQLPEPDRNPVTWIGLLWIQVLAAAGPGLQPLPDVNASLGRALVAAETAGLGHVAADGYNLLAFLHEYAGETGRVSASTLRAADIAYPQGGLLRARQFARTARCLLEVEQDVHRARELLAEAIALAGRSAGELHELQMGLGLLARWDGSTDSAVQHIQRALAITRAEGQRWREYKCLKWLTITQLQRGLWAEVTSLCGNIVHLAKQLGDDCPLADALAAIAALSEGAIGDWERLDAALVRLRRMDDKSELAYALNETAARYLRVGRSDAADACARQALSAAVSVRRRGEAAVARALLARISLASEPQRSAARIRRLVRVAGRRDRIGSRGIAAIVEAAATAGLAIPSTIPTLAPTLAG